MSFFTTPLFEILIYFFFITTSIVAYKKHGRNVIFLFGMIIAIALAIEIPAISKGSYDYLNFIIYIFNYPFSLPLGWCVFFYWAHTFSEAIIEWDGSLVRALMLAGITGVLTGSMSLFLEPGGQVLGWWLYHNLGATGVGWFGVPIEINATYFVWGAFDAFVFRMFMYQNWLQRNDLQPPILNYYPAYCALFFFSLMLVNILTTPNFVLLFVFPNVTIWSIIYIFRYKKEIPMGFKETQPVANAAIAD